MRRHVALAGKGEQNPFLLRLRSVPCRFFLQAYEWKEENYDVGSGKEFVTATCWVGEEMRRFCCKVLLPFLCYMLIEMFYNEPYACGTLATGP